MRKLIYFLDAARRDDLKMDSKYLKVINEFRGGNYSYSAEKYFTTYPSTYRWFITTFNMIDDPERLGYKINKPTGTQSNPCKSSLFKLLAKELGYKLRMSEVNLSNNYYNTIRDGSGSGMLDGWMEFMTREELLEDTEDNVIDFIYDIAFHDQLMEVEDVYTDTIKEKVKILDDAYEYSKILFNTEFFNKYDQVWIVSDHGYSDWIQDVYWQHDKDHFGNPCNHSNPNCLLISKNEYDYPESFDKLITQYDLVNLWLDRSAQDRSSIVINGYDLIERRYPMHYWIINDDLECIHVDLGMFEYYTKYSREVEVFKIPNGYKSKETIELTQDIWDKLYLLNPNVPRVMDYLDFKG